MRLIDADAVISDLQAMKKQFDAITFDALIEGIEKKPTIEAEPVRHGRWREINVPKKWGGSTLLGWKLFRLLNATTTTKKEGAKDMNMLNLKPCPFCGGGAKMRYLVPTKEAYVMCYDCDVTTTLYRGIDRKNSEEFAAEAWNRRANDEG